MRLIPRLLELQHAHGYLTEDLMRQVAREANVPLYRIQGLVSFYPHFRTSPPPKTEIAVCRDMACWLKDPLAAARVREHHAGSADVQVRECSCLGRCDTAPAVMINDVPQLPLPAARRRTWKCDPYSTEDDRYGLLRRALEQPRDELITAIKNSGLKGMGGAGFATGTKWELVRNETRTPKYVICNA